MKRIAIFLVIALVSGFAVFAEEATVINFTELLADYPADNAEQNQATLTDFSQAAGLSFSDAEKAQMKTSLAIANWDVILNSSAKSVISASNSFTREAKIKKDSTMAKAGDTILGVRVYFPVEAVNSYALVTPPFEIPAYADIETVDANGNLVVSDENKGKGSKFVNKGVVKNVGVIKSISVSVLGNNFPHGLSVILKDQTNREQEFFLGYMNFDGWREMSWANPNYITDVRDRELRTFPLYPESAPYIKLVGFRIYKDASMKGGDFVGYIKNVNIVYDKAVLDLDNRDVDDEGTWNILQDREATRRNAEMSRLGQRQVLRYLEKQKMDGAEAAASTDGAQQQ